MKKKLVEILHFFKKNVPKKLECQQKKISSLLNIYVSHFLYAHTVSERLEYALRLEDVSIFFLLRI